MAEMLSLKLLARPLEAVMVVATAEMPMTIPRVVRMARRKLARRALKAMASDSNRL